MTLVVMALPCPVPTLWRSRQSRAFTRYTMAINNCIDGQGTAMLGPHLAALGPLQSLDQHFNNIGADGVAVLGLLSAPAS
jgi:hypothetical protein